MRAFSTQEVISDLATERKEERLAKARLQLIKAENSLGVVTAEAVNGKVWHLDKHSENQNRLLITTLSSLQETSPWIGIVGVRDLGWVAAVEAGINLEKLLLVTPPLTQVADILAELVDGFDITVCGQIFLNRAEKTRLAAKVRKRRNILLTLEPWGGISRQWNLPAGRYQVERAS
ncbi:hypothetical protein NXS08_02030 [Gleimia sp. 6138-11-ORH1]|uniref:hypothetical protein n=1 Tax=Gleimia sp. 6138-11-ORH1 TaxID=2973937 RepID=UPI002169FC09|nr:hypothetical protein [Gleimia sp. 6138-11-ORH1]MCS4484270.1 hypothetical protein [Gleimia sp. 6138-11-ORH1]